MLGTIRQSIATALGIWGLTVAVCAGGGHVFRLAYLPTVGPTPLRFRTAPTPTTNWTSIVAPVPPDQMPVEEEPTNYLPAIAPIPQSIVTTAGTTTTTTAPAVDSPQQATQPVVQNPVISPQMFLKFFNPTNNVTAPAAASPQQSVGFTPPPVQVPSSGPGPYVAPGSSK